MPGIFVSYRRKDSAGHAGRLFDRLRDHFGKDRVFRDVDRLKAGEDFVEALARAVDSCDVFILVIGRDWLEARNERGQRRLDDPNDFIRLEVETALRRKVLVLPVLVEGAAMPEPSDLPEPLGPLARRQAIELSEHRWDFDVQELLRAIEEAGGGKKRGRTRVALWAIVGAGVLALAAAATSRIWWPWLNGTRPPAVSTSSTPSTPTASTTASSAPPLTSPPVTSTQAPPAGEPPAGRGTSANQSAQSPPVQAPKVPSEPGSRSTGQASPKSGPTQAAVQPPSDQTPPRTPPSDNPKPPGSIPRTDDPDKKPTPAPPAPTQVTVPDVTGQQIRSVAGDLDKLGLRMKVESSSGGRGEPGTVFAQRPPAGSLMERGGVLSLNVVASLRPNEHVAGSANLSPGRVLDLDGDDEGRGGWDVSFERTNDQFLLSLGRGVLAAFLPTTPAAPGGRSSFDPASCEGVRLSATPLPMSERTSGQQVCVRTSGGRTAAIFLGRLTPDPPELSVRYSTLESTRAEPQPPIVGPAPRMEPPFTPRNPSPAVGSCAQAVQGRIAWDYSGNRTWAAANVERLCRGATDDQPAACFDRVMRGGINWGGGTRWEPEGALDLCEGTRNASATIDCFQRYISARRPMREAIAACDERSSTRRR